MFCLLTQVCFTALCALLLRLFFFSFFLLFFHSTGFSDNPGQNNRKIKGKSPSQEFYKFLTCSRSMFTSLVDVNLLPNWLGT